MKRKRNANPTTPPAGYVVIMISSSSCRLGTTQTCPPVYLCSLVSHAASNLTEELTGSALDLRISRLSTQQTKALHRYKQFAALIASASFHHLRFQRYEVVYASIRCSRDYHTPLRRPKAG